MKYHFEVVVMLSCNFFFFFLYFKLRFMQIIAYAITFQYLSMRCALLFLQYSINSMRLLFNFKNTFLR